ncbi:MAG: hypothetical protein ACM31C_09490 [Acidobacteriota bacterium]
MLRWLLPIALIACGRPGHGELHADATAGDDGAADASAADAAPADAAPADATAADAALPDAPPPLVVTGTCTYVDQPGWLSCPTGMACQCYYRYDKLFQDQPAHLELTQAPSELDITGGALPQNDTFPSAEAAKITLSGSPPTGSAYPYTATITATGVEVDVYAFGGYVPASDVLYSDADCGNEGQILQCKLLQ